MHIFAQAAAESMAKIVLLYLENQQQHLTPERKEEITKQANEIGEAIGKFIFISLASMTIFIFVMMIVAQLMISGAAEVLSYIWDLLKAFKK